MPAVLDAHRRRDDAGRYWTRSCGSQGRRHLHWRFACTTEDGKPVKQGFTQREWFLPASHYLIVTWFDDLPVADLLAKSAQWR